jgi:hypothetical protein
MVRYGRCGAAIALLLFGTTAEAQMRWEDRGFVNASVGSQAGSDDLSVDVGRDVYDERMSIQSSVDGGGGALWDVAGGYRVWRNLVVGLGYSRFANDNDVTATITIPNPLVTDAPRSGSAAAGLEHSETAVHFIASWMIPVTDKIDVALFGGPSIFSLTQDVITDVAFTEVGSPFTSVDIGGPTVTEASATGVGVNIGADVTYLVARRVGVGGFLRYTGGNVSFDEAGGFEMTAGGVQIGFGVRYRF